MWLHFCRPKMEDMRMRVSTSMWSWTFWRSPTYMWWENPWGNSRRWYILPSTNNTGSHLWILRTGWNTSGWEPGLCHITSCSFWSHDRIRWPLYPDFHTHAFSLMFRFSLPCFKIFHFTDSVFYLGWKACWDHFLGLESWKSSWERKINSKKFPF